MASVTIESILEQIAGLPPGEQERLRALLNGMENQQTFRPASLIKPANPIREPDLAGAMEWLALNSDDYAGQWVALDGGRLILHSDDHSKVAEAAKTDGAYLPLITYIEPKPERPFTRV